MITVRMYAALIPTQKVGKEHVSSRLQITDAQSALDIVIAPQLTLMWELGAGLEQGEPRMARNVGRVPGLPTPSTFRKRSVISYQWAADHTVLMTRTGLVGLDEVLRTLACRVDAVEVYDFK